MKAPEERLIELLDAKEKELLQITNYYDQLIAKARKKLKNCTHPKEAHIPYSWYWDSGYGSGGMREGVQCRICRKKNSWPGSSNNWYPAD